MFIAPTSNTSEAELIAERDACLATARARDAYARSAKDDNGRMFFSTGAQCARRDAARIQARIT